MTDKIEYFDDVTVELVKHAASDCDVLHAARVSTQAEASLEGHPGPCGELSKKDVGLINYLMRDRHGSPFEHTSFTFLVKAPIFVFREFHRHRVWSYNEESGRYRELRPHFYQPNRDRPLIQVGKPGAYDFVEGSAQQYRIMLDAGRIAYEVCYEQYIRQLDAGICREVARRVLPVGLFSTMYATCNSRALMHFLSLRTKRLDSKFPSFPQREIEMVAEKLEEHFARLMPITHAAFEKNGRVAP